MPRWRTASGGRAAAGRSVEDMVAEYQQGAQPTAEGAMVTRIGQVVMLHHGGDREEARSRFLALWSEIGEDGDPFHRCTLAHYMADTQDDPVDELAWDLRALSAAEEMARLPPPARGAPGGPPAARAFLPSLHLSLAEDYDRLGRAEAARSQVRRARGAVAALGDDRYGNRLRAAIARLERRLTDKSI